MTNEIKKKETPILKYFEVAIGWAIGYLIVKVFGPLVFFIILIPVLIGLFFPGWYLKRTNINSSLIKGIAYSNLITWFLPPIGLMTSIATFSFSSSEKIENRQKYKKLAIVGIVLSVINSVLGIILGLLK